jgi:hypothetical protein
VTGSFASAREHVELALARRTHGDPARVPSVYAPGLAVSTGRVLAVYLGDAFDREAGRKPPPLSWLLARRHGEGLACVVAAAAWALARARRLSVGYRRRVLALVAATAAALAGAFGWLVVFKAHAYQHGHIDPLVWHLGSFVAGAALVGWALGDALRLASRRAPQA